MLVLVLVLKLVLVLLLEPLLWRGVEADAGIRCRGQGQACVGTTCKVEETTGAALERLGIQTFQLFDF